MSEHTPDIDYELAEFLLQHKPEGDWPSAAVMVMDPPPAAELVAAAARADFAFAHRWAANMLGIPNTNRTGTHDEWLETVARAVLSRDRVAELEAEKATLAKENATLANERDELLDDLERDAICGTGEEPHLSQPALVAGIMFWLERSGGVKEMNPRQMNAVIEAANLIVAAIETPHQGATPGMGLHKWLASDDTGQSSLYMARALAGAAFPNHRYLFDGLRSRDPWPHDPSDFGRCVRLLDAVPELRPHVPLLKEPQHKKVWNAIAAEWDTLEAWYRADLPTGKSDRLYKRLQELEAGGA